MKALILAAGKGTRLRPLTDDIPKVMVEVDGKPLIEHIIDDILSIGIEQITVVKGYKGEKLEEGLEKYSGIDFEEQEEQLGTAHAIGISSFEEPFLVVNGDVFIHRENLSRAVSFFKGEENVDAVIGSYTVEDPEEFGVLETQNSSVKNILEKPDDPPTNLINTGVYVFSPVVYNIIERTGLSERGEYEITESLKMMIDRGMDVRHVRFDRYWIDVGRHEDLERARNLGV